MRNDTQLSYLSRVERVRSYIYDHLDEDLNLDKLAEVACFSYYHLHRIYHGLAGETVAQTVRRLRMHRAAVDLIQTSMDIDNIAKKAGYGSIAAFSRAFSSAYGEPPVRYRDRTQEPPFNHGITPQEIYMFDVTIQKIDDIKLAAIAHKGNYQGIGQCFDAVGAWAAQKDILNAHTRMIGIYYDDPSATKEENLRSEAGIVIENDIPSEKIQSGLEVRTVEITGHRCAVLRFKGPYAELEKAYYWLFGQWLAQSGEEAADAPAFEEYLNDPKSTPPSELLTDIHLPLK